MNQLKPIYNSPLKNSHSHPVHTCFPIIAGNEQNEVPQAVQKYGYMDGQNRSLVSWTSVYSLIFLHQERVCDEAYITNGNDVSSQFYSANRRLAQTKPYSSNFIAIIVNRSD